MEEVKERLVDSRTDWGSSCLPGQQRIGIRRIIGSILHFQEECRE
jgi:hypothetical protein